MARPPSAAPRGMSAQSVKSIVFLLMVAGGAFMMLGGRVQRLYEEFGVQGDGYIASQGGKEAFDGSRSPTARTNFYWLVIIHRLFIYIADEDSVPRDRLVASQGKRTAWVGDRGWSLLNNHSSLCG